MKCSHPDCNRGIGLISYWHGWFDKRRYCSEHCCNAMAAETNSEQRHPRSLLSRFVIALIVFVGLTLSATFAIAALAAPTARSEVTALPGCARDVALASANVAAVRERMKNLESLNASDRCRATRLYFLELVKARAVTSLCKAGAGRDQDLGNLDADVSHANDAIAARCP